MATREEEVLVNSLQSPNFAITGTSLYFIRATVHSRQIYRLSLAKAHDADGAELVSTIPITENVPRVLEGISVAPDDSEVVFSMPSGQTLELQYVRHFR